MSGTTYPYYNINRLISYLLLYVLTRSGNPMNRGDNAPRHGSVCFRIPVGV